jgi:hypothetical protein
LPVLVGEGVEAFAGEGAGTLAEEGVILVWEVRGAAVLNMLVDLCCMNDVVAVAVGLTVKWGQSLDMSTLTRINGMVQSRGLSRRSIYLILGKSVIMAERFTLVRLLFFKMRTSTQFSSA